MYTRDLQGIDGRAYQNGIRSHFNRLDLLLLLFCFGWFVRFYFCPWAIYTLVLLTQAVFDMGSILWNGP